MEKTHITIVGAGVVGLAVAAELSKSYQDIIVVERHDSFGRETSSRNSEVIHAGIYYIKNSLKALTCVEGRPLLYRFCVENNVLHRRAEKLIVAKDSSEVAQLEAILRRGRENGVEDLRWLTQAEVKKLEPNVRAEGAIYSPQTGIIDSHTLMQKLADQFTSRGGMIVYNTEVVGIQKSKEGFEVEVRDTGGETLKVSTKILINAAGLSADKVSALAGVARPEYRLKYCKGVYFRVRSSKAKMVSRLIYPVPTENHTGLGVHATLDLAGQMRLGPDAEYVSEIDYTVEASKQKNFHEGVAGFLPFIEFDDLSPDTAGVRPKLQGPGEPVKDFVIKNEAEEDLPGLINLVGIESPGLTACLSISRRVEKLVKDII